MLQRGTVLIVEDDEETREMMTHFLGMEGFRIRCAKNGAEALETLQRDGRACVIVLDLMMPVMDGWQFRRRQRADAALAAIPVIVVSAVANRRELSALEAAECIQKPIDFDRLLESVTQCCQPQP